MSKYVEIFKELRSACEDDFILYGDFILVNILQDKEIKSAGGIVLSTPDNHRINSMNQNKPIFCEVLEVGEGFADSSGNTTPVGAEVGEILVVGQNAPLAFSRFGQIPMSGELQLALIRESEIIMHFPGRESYERYINRLQSAINGLRSG